MKRALLAACLAHGACSAEAARHAQRAANPALETPNLTGYDPAEVLCSLGKTAEGSPKVQGWCQDWLGCVKAKASPAGDAAAVMGAWAPADCREVCGQWPTLSAPEGQGASLISKARRDSAALGLGAGRDCLASCGRFQESLSTCVATILFEPGRVASMGLPKDEPAAPAHCREKSSPCLPDLPIEHQKCIAHKTKKVLDRSHVVPEETQRRCDMIKIDMETCKDCPQSKDGFVSQYHAFVGGCMDQLNAYHQATHPQAGSAAIPGAAGCTVH